MTGALDKSTVGNALESRQEKKFIRSSHKEKNLLEFPWKSSITFNYIQDAALSE